MNLNEMLVLAGVRSGEARHEDWNLDPLTESEVANTILKQLGGTGRLGIMLGAKQFMSVGDNAVSFKWPSPHGGPNYVKITLMPSDTYRMEFFRGTKLVKTLDDIYVGQLIPTFEKVSGMALRL